MMELKFDKCMECGRTFAGYAGLSKHIPQAHPGISNQEYYDKYYKKSGEGICPVCGKPTQFSGRLNRGYYEHCSKQCTALDKKVDAKRRATKKELYGDECFNNHVKTTQTKIDRYGDANYANGDQIRATKLERYGQAGYNNPEKRKQTKLEKYGASNYVNKEKAADTKELRYGDRSYNNHEKTEATKLAKYGDPNYVNREKAKETHTRRIIDKYTKLLENKVSITGFDQGMFHCVCKTCGNRFDIPNNTGYMRLFRYGTNWCTVCNPAETSKSKTESALFNYVKGLDGSARQSCRDVIKGIELDIYVSEKNLAVEFDGLYWHDERKKDWAYHVCKTELCEKNGIRLVHVFEDEWQYRMDIVKSRLAGILGMNRNIYARKCAVRELDSTTADKFVEENHIQGSCVSSWRYGLFDGEELVAVMTFGKNRFGDGIELMRFCTKKYISVVGGASKLFKAFVRSHTEVESVVSFADRRWSGPDAFYPKLGFMLDGITRPSYYYVINGMRHNRMEFTKKKLVDAGFDASMTEHDIMLSRKIYRIYDCGNYRYVWNRT